MSIEPLLVAEPAFSGWIGVGRETITPPVGIYARNWGAAEHDVAEGIHRPLTASAIAMKVRLAAPPCVLVSLDLGWWRTAADEWALRQAVLEECYLDPVRVMISLSHTHAGPAICREDSDKPGGHLIAPYMDRMREAVLRVVRSALQTCRPGTMTWKYGRCGLARFRDLPDPEGDRVVCGFHPGQPADDTLLVGRAVNEEGRTLATLVNYACHPTTLAWQNRVISPDYVGAMREVVEAHTGKAPCLFLQGASGELAPREQYTDDTAIADRNGRQLGHAVMAVLEGMLPPRQQLRYSGAVESGAPLATWTLEPNAPSEALEATQMEVELPLKALPSLAEIDAQSKTCQDRALAERLARKRRVRVSVGEGATTRMPLWIWRAGDAILVGQPNEAYSQLQTGLRRQFPGTPILVMNCVNGPYCGYLSPQELYGQDLYQVWQSPFERGCLELVQEQILSRLIQPQEQEERDG